MIANVLAMLTNLKFTLITQRRRGWEQGGRKEAVEWKLLLEQNVST